MVKNITIIIYFIPYRNYSSVATPPSLKISFKSWQCILSYSFLFSPAASRGQVPAPVDSSLLAVRLQTWVRASVENIFNLYDLKLNTCGNCDEFDSSFVCPRFESVYISIGCPFSTVFLLVRSGLLVHGSSQTWSRVMCTQSIFVTHFSTECAPPVWYVGKFASKSTRFPVRNCVQ